MGDSLIITVEDGSGRRFVTGTSDDTILVGRSPMADLRLMSAAVSAVHVKLVAGDGVIRAQDLGAKNGTTLDDRALPPQELVEVPSGSVLDVGATFRITFSWGSAPAAVENPFAQGEVEEDDGTARLHPAALLALRERLEKREAASERGRPSLPEPPTFPSPATFPVETPPAPSLSLAGMAPPQPPSLDLPWMGRDATAAPASAPTPATAPAAIAPKQISRPAPSARGRISLSGTADAASFGVGEMPQEPGSATVVRAPIGPSQTAAPVRSAPSIPAASAPLPLPAQGPAPNTYPMQSASASPFHAPFPAAVAPALPADGHPGRSPSQEPPGELRVRLSSGEELRSTTPSRSNDSGAASSSRRTGASRTTGSRRTLQESPRRTASRRPVNRRPSRPWLLPMIAAAVVVVLGAFAWVTVRVTTSTGDQPAPRHRHESEQR